MIDTNLTPKQEKLYNYILDHQKKSKVGLSYDDMINFMGLSTKGYSTIHYYVNELERKGFIKRKLGKVRSVRAIT